MNRTDYLLFLAGVLVLATPGAIGANYTYVWTAALLFGFLIASFPVVRVGVALPSSALAFLLALNLGFWVFYLLWRWQAGATAPDTGLRAVTGAASGWVALLALTALYEFFVFLGAWRAREQREVCAAGFAGLAVQIGTMVFILWQLV